jgi:murein DD-endopeptidase MepM/ murein hydrolase activator NlpD
MMRRLFSALVIVLLASAAFVLVGATERVEAEASSLYPLTAAPRYEAARDLVPAFVRDTFPPEEALPVMRRLGSGQTLGGVFDELGFDAHDAEAAVQASLEHLDPRRLRAGSRYSAWYTRDGDLTSVSFHLDGKGRLQLERSGDEWLGRMEPFDRRRVVRQASGSLSSSLTGAVVDAGAPAAVAYRMADVLQWDVDFNRDLRLGDRFDVVYEEVLVEGEFHQVGRVLALVLENGGRRLEAYEYADGYYDADGRPLRKLFLRSPLPYSRITSRFSHRRFHPVLKTYRPHYGVDYGAPAGTPVRATAAGVVKSAGWTKGGGKTVKLRHPNQFETQYLHLSRFADEVSSGRRVAQGDVIGFVGSTGLATAAHLDYRVRHRGKWLDPTSMGNEPAPAIAELERGDFLARRETLRADLALFYGSAAHGLQLASTARDRPAAPAVGR